MDGVCEDDGFKVGVVKEEGIEIEVLKCRVSMVELWSRWCQTVMRLED